MSDGDAADAASGSAATAAAAAPGGDDRIGAVVDKYTIVRLLGRGGMGAVYEARHGKLARRFAIKFLLPQLATDPQVLRRFENESRAAGGLEHPNLAAVMDAGRAADGAPYLVMEYLQGEDCARLLRRTGPLPVPRAANIVLQACRGLDVAHRAGIVHRDLKPENIFLTDAGDGSDLVKVLDFGIAKLQQSDATVATGTGATFGTAFYMSPEQARGAGDVDGRADVWSLGVVLYELLSGRRPFEGDQFLNVVYQILSVEPAPLATRREGLPPSIVAVVERAMTKDLSGRFPSVAALADALAPLARGAVSAAPPAGDARHGLPSATRATPATNARESVPNLPGALGGGAGAMPEARPGSRPPTGAPATRSRAPALVAGALAVVVLIVAAAWLARGGRAPAVAPGAAPAAVARQPMMAPAASTPREPAAPVAPPPAAAPGPSMPASPPVRTASGQSEHGVPRRAPHAPAARTSAPAPALKPATPPTAPAAPATVAAPPPVAAPPVTAPARAGHPITIEKDNPYGT